MHVAVTGSSGLIGTALTASLEAGGHQVTRVVRREARPGEIRWDPEAGEIDAEGLRAADAVVHLAGHLIPARRWTSADKRRLRDSRVQGTRLLAEAMAAQPDGPRVLVSASGVSYYGNRGDERLTEDSGHGEGFMAKLCVEWEAATTPAAEAGVRVACLRTGIVQTPDGGALGKQLPLFKLGVGGRMGSGSQWMSWISLDDIVGIYEHALTHDTVSGPVNATAPEPVTNAEYARVLGRVLGRPAVLPIPRFGPRLVLGEVADELLFVSIRGLPERALDTGYVFRHSDLESCLRDALAAPEAAGGERRAG